MTTRHAADERCTDCGSPAVVFWPCIDPDIPSRPYCRPCVERRRMELLIMLLDKQATAG